MAGLAAAVTLCDRQPFNVDSNQVLTLYNNMSTDHFELVPIEVGVTLLRLVRGEFSLHRTRVMLDKLLKFIHKTIESTADDVVVKATALLFGDKTDWISFPSMLKERKVLSGEPSIADRKSSIMNVAERSIRAAEQVIESVPQMAMSVGDDDNFKQVVQRITETSGANNVVTKPDLPLPLAQSINLALFQKYGPEQQKVLMASHCYSQLVSTARPWPSQSLVGNGELPADQRLKFLITYLFTYKMPAHLVVDLLKADNELSAHALVGKPRNENEGSRHHFFRLFAYVATNVTSFYSLQDKKGLELRLSDAEIDVLTTVRDTLQEPFKLTPELDNPKFNGIIEHNTFDAVQIKVDVYEEGRAAVHSLVCIVGDNKHTQLACVSEGFYAPVTAASKKKFADGTEVIALNALYNKFEMPKTDAENIKIFAPHGAVSSKTFTYASYQKVGNGTPAAVQDTLLKIAATRGIHESAFMLLGCRGKFFEALSRNNSRSETCIRNCMKGRRETLAVQMREFTDKFREHTNGFSPKKLEKASKQFRSGRPLEIFLSGTIILLSAALKPTQQKLGMQVFFTYSKAVKMKGSDFSDYELELRVSRLNASFSMTLNVKARTGFLNKSTRLILVRPNQKADLWAFGKV